MRPIGYRRFAQAAAAVIMLAVPAAKAGQVTVDLGLVAVSIGINASIGLSGFPSDTDTYTYQQLQFLGNLSMEFDNTQTLGQVLAQDLGNANIGTLDYNFPFTSGASGSYAQNALQPSFATGNMGSIGFTAITQSGHVCSGSNSAGSSLTLDPLLPATTFETILGCEAFSGVNDGTEMETVTTLTLPPLGTITSAGTTTVYVGEFTDYEWISEGASISPGGPPTVPEPSSLWLGGGGLAALGWIRIRGGRRRRLPM